MAEEIMEFLFGMSGLIIWIIPIILMIGYSDE